MTQTNQTVLSIRSHVVTGYVGNKSATFPMQVRNGPYQSESSVHSEPRSDWVFWKYVGYIPMQVRYGPNQSESSVHTEPYSDWVCWK